MQLQNVRIVLSDCWLAYFVFMGLFFVFVFFFWGGGCLFVLGWGFLSS